MTNWYDNIPAPVDSNGRVMPLDIKELVYEGETREVYGLVYSIRFRSWFVEFGDLVDIRLGACTSPDSWERLEEDARKTPREYIEGRCIPVGRDGRVAAMARDLVLRAKALAGRGANGCNEERISKYGKRERNEDGKD